MANKSRTNNLVNLGMAIVATAKESMPEGAPSGVMYAAAMSAGFSLDEYNAVIEALKGMGKIKVEGHLIKA